MAERRLQPRVISLSEARSERTYRRLLAELLAYCRLHLDDEPLAVDQFYGPDPTEEELELIQEAFVDWLAFGYQDWHGRTMIERFVQDFVTRDDAERNMLMAWQSTRPGLYQVLSQDEGVVQLRDTVTDAEFGVQQEEGMAAFSISDLVVCRVLPVGDGCRFGLDVRSGPGSAQPAIRRALEGELARLRHQEPEADWVDLFAHRWPLVNEAMTTAILMPDESTAFEPPTPPSLGLTVPPAGCSPLHMAVHQLVLAYDEISTPDRLRAVRLWWDAAALVNPRTGRAGGWAAGVVHALLTFPLLEADVTREELAEMFGVSATTVTNRSREIGQAVGLLELDPRYSDPLDPRVRCYPSDAAAIAAARQAPADASAYPETTDAVDVLTAIRREARKEAALLTASVGPATPLAELLALHDKLALEGAARRLSAPVLSRYRKADLADLLASLIGMQPMAAFWQLIETDRAVVRYLLKAGAPVAWTDFCRKWGAQFHPALDHNSPGFGAWELGLVHIGTPPGAPGAVIFIPDELAAALRQLFS